MEVCEISIGIDIGKTSFHAALYRSSSSERGAGGKAESLGQFANSDLGMTEFIAVLAARGIMPSQAHCCMEATGHYFELIADTLVEKGYRVSVVNPTAIKHFARAEQIRTKNDSVDARTIALYAAPMQPTIWQKPTQTQRDLQELTRYRSELVAERAKHKNRIEAARREGKLRVHLQQMLDLLDDSIEAVEADIQALVDNDDRFSNDAKLLESIGGIGTTTAHALLGELPLLHSYTSARQLAAHAGVTPRERQSGSSVQGVPRISKVGNTSIMKILWNAAIASLRSTKSNPAMVAFGERLTGKNKKRKQIICAAIRKLLHQIFGVIHSGKMFDPAFHTKFAES